MRLAPAWVKGYSRLGSCLLALDRYDDCIAACRTGPWRGLHSLYACSPRMPGCSPRIRLLTMHTPAHHAYACSPRMPDVSSHAVQARVVMMPFRHLCPCCNAAVAALQLCHMQLLLQCCCGCTTNAAVAAPPMLL